MLSLIVFVAITHLAVGYALAIYLGYASIGEAALQGAVVTDYASLVADEDIIIADDLEDDDDAIEIPDESEPEIADSTGLPDDSDDEPEEVESVVPLDDATEALLTSEIARLFQLLAGFREQLAHGESPSWGTDADKAATGLGDIAAFTDAAGCVLDELTSGSTSLPEGSRLCQRISAAREQFAASLSIGLRNVGAVDSGQADSGPALQQQFLAAHEAAFAFCKVLHDVQLELAQRSGWLERMEETFLVDNATQLASGPGFVKVLDAQRQADGLTEKQIVATFDVDNCQRANATVGPMLGDQMLVHVGKYIRDTLDPHAAVGRLSGQRFAVLLPAVMLNAATDEIERVRESIAATRFRRGDVTWEITVSCALTEPAADEPTVEILKRLDETTLEAKRYGKNRTFLHEDGNPAPIVPPKIEVEPQVIELTDFESS